MRGADLIIFLIPFVPSKRCPECRGLYRLAYSTRDNVLACAFVIFVVVGGLSVQARSFWPYLALPLIGALAVWWVVHFGRTSAPLPFRLLDFIALGIVCAAVAYTAFLV